MGGHLVHGSKPDTVGPVDTGQKRGTAFALPVTILLCVCLVLSCGEPIATPVPAYIRAAGAAEMDSLLVDLAVAFRELHPLVHFEIESVGDQFGLEALSASEVDLAFVSWLPSEGSGMVTGPWQLLDDWQAVAVARDGLAVIVHPDNPLPEVGLLQLGDVFAGKVSSWVQVGGLSTQGSVQPVSREAGSGPRGAFESMVTDGRRLTPLAVVQASDASVVSYVARNPNAIGYVSMSQVTGDVRVLPVEGELPEPGTVGRGVYPLTHGVWFVVPVEASKAVQSFVEFAHSAAGQQIVSERYGTVR